MTNRINTKPGFTLIETILMIMVFIIIIVALFSAIVRGLDIYRFSAEQAYSVDEARRGIEVMVKEIRSAQPGDDGSYVIEKANDFEFAFFADIDHDLQTEKVRYYLDGTNFKKGVVEPSGSPIQYPLENEQLTILSRYVRNPPPVFRYFNGDGEELTELAIRLSDTKMMRVSLVINIDPNRPPVEFYLESDVQLRNLKTNL